MLQVETTMSANDVVSRDPDVMHGVAVFAGTRVYVESLLEHLKAGDTLEEFLAGFPSVNRQQAEAFLDFAFQFVATKITYARAA